MTPFLDLVAAEVARARGKHPPIHSLHEGYAVLLEEVDELWDEVRRQKHASAAVLAELVQIAAMAMRVAEDCGLLDLPGGAECAAADFGVS